MSDPEDYEGGLLEFDTRIQDEPNGKSNIVPCKQILPNIFLMYKTETAKWTKAAA